MHLHAAASGIMLACGIMLRAARERITAVCWLRMPPTTYKGHFIKSANLLIEREFKLRVLTNVA